MPSAVLVHIGCSGPFIKTRYPPEWLRHCVQQYFTWNDDDLYILTDQENLEYLPKHPKIYPILITDYSSDKIARFSQLYNYPTTNFWTVAALRFIYLENFLREANLRHIYHFENDVLLYFNIAKYHQDFQDLYPNIAITLGGPEHTMTGFMYIDSHRSLEHMTDFFIATLEQRGIQGIRSHYKVNLVSEMSLMVAYERDYGSEYLAHLPTMPFEGYDTHLDVFGGVFDPSGWGHFIDGSRHGEPPGFCAPWTYIGQMLEANPQYTIVWKDKCPYFSYDDKLVKINNLHIHTKNLERYLS